MRTKVIILMALALVTLLIIFRTVRADCGELPNGIELGMPIADAFQLMKPYGAPDVVDGVFTWNVDGVSSIRMGHAYGVVKSYELSLTKNNTRKTFNSFTRLWQLRVVEAYNAGYRVEFEVPLIVCYTCGGKHLYFIEITSNDGMLTLKRRWSK